MKNSTWLILVIAVFLFFYFLPLDNDRVHLSFMESLHLTQEYARKHVLFCLIPAFFIAGAITSFIRKEAILKFLGPQANKVIAYSVASISGTILAVCSCTVLPLFAGIYKRGAGIGPASAFLYSGPAINILSIILTARVLGMEIGIARLTGAVVFSVVIGIIMELLFRNEKVPDAAEYDASQHETARSDWVTIIYFVLMIAVLVFANWASDERLRVWNMIYSIKWYLTLVFLGLLLLVLMKWFKKQEIKEWVNETWIFSKQIIPLLFAGVLVSGFLFGRPGHEALIPERFISSLVGGNSISANLIASVAGALMYFATLTEVPILQGLMSAGMGKGPALALLLAGPALSLPSMIVLRSLMGTKKALTYILLVVIMSTLTGLISGSM